MSPKATDLEAVRRFQSEVASIREAPEPYAIRMTIHVLAAAVVMIVIILTFAKVDRVISSSSGKIVATIKPSVFQALDDSIIKSIDVKEGERVVKGQVLATLDPTFTGADVKQLADQIASLDAQIARAWGEQQDREPEFSVVGGASNEQYIALQHMLYEQRKAQYKAQLNSFDQKIGQTQATIQKGVDDETRLMQREQIAKQVDDMRATLLEKGAGSLLNKLTSQDQRVELQRTLENTHNGVIEAEHQLASLRADREAFIQSWSTDISKEVVTAENSRDTAVSQLEKAKRHQELVRIVAPEDSVVLSVTKLSIGSILKSAEPLITVTPTAAPVEAELNIAARDVGFLRPGDFTTLKVDAFNYTEHGVAEGSVKWISEGAFVINDDTNQPVQEPYYRVRAKIDKLSFVKLPENFRLIPGMTLVGDINVGRRSLGSYLLEGFIKGAGGAMREP